MKFTIHKRKDGIYYAEKMYKGKRYYFSSKDKKEVEQQLIEFERNKRKSIVLENTPMTVAQWSNKWLDMYKKNVTKNTYDMYLNAIQTHIIPHIGNIKLIDLKQSYIIDMFNILGDKARTKEVCLITIKQILDKAVENDYIPKNVATGIKLLKTKHNEKEPLNEKQIKAIKNIAETNSEFYIFYFMIYTGLRAGEVVSIQWSDINLKNKTISINKSYDFHHKEVKSVKNGEDRTIPIFNNLVSFLQSQNKTDKYLFNKNGNMLSYEILRGRIERLNKMLGCNNITIHTLRHTYACLLYKAGITAKQAQKWTGHKEIKVLLNIYTHLDEKDNDNAISKVNSFLSVF